MSESEKQYSWNELVQISNDIDRVLKQSKKKKNEGEEIVESGMDRILAFKLRTNQKKANNAIELIEEENFPEKNEEHDKYVQEKINIAQEFGGQVRQVEGRIMVDNYNELLKNKEFDKKMTELDEEFKETIEKEKARQKVINEESRKKSGVVEWAHISIDLFPVELSGEDLPLSFLEFVTE